MNLLKKILKLVSRKIVKEKEIWFFVIFLLSLFFILKFASQFYFTKIPKENAELHEVVISEKPLFINPVLASSNIDKTLVSLFYQPLFKKDEKNKIGNLKVGDNQKEYFVTINKGFHFHDGKEITIDDFIYTIEKIKDPRINSPLNGYFFNVKVEKIDNSTAKLTLANKNYYFKEILEDLSIIPKHIWEKIEYFSQSKENIGPVGYGEFELENLVWDEDFKDKKLREIILTRYKNKGYINKIYFHFFDSLDEYLDSELYQDKTLVKTLFSVDELKELDKYVKYKIKEENDFNFIIKNNNQNEFLKKIEIRKLLFKIWNDYDEKPDEIIDLISKNKNFKLDTEKNILKYKDKVVIFSTVVGNNKDHQFLILAKEFKEKLKKFGITMNLRILEEKEFWESIKTRDFESIILGYNTKTIFWPYYFHSSQKNDPGLNIAQFSSKKLDNLLFKLKTSKNEEEEEKNKEAIKKEIESYFVILKLTDEYSYYYSSREILNNNFSELESSIKRFENIDNWVIKEQNVLKIFNKK